MNNKSFDYEKAQQQEDADKDQKTVSDKLLQVLQIILGVIMAIIHV